MRSLFIAILICGLCSPFAAHAQTLDPGQTATELVNFIGELKLLKEEAENLKKKATLSNLSGLAGGDLGKLQARITDAAPNTDRFKPQVPSDLADDAEDPQAGAEFAEENLIAPSDEGALEEMTPEDRENLKKKQEAVEQVAITGAYGTALSLMKMELEQQETQADMLSEAENAENSRENKEFLNALSLQIMGQISRANLLQASILEMNAATAARGGR